MISAGKEYMAFKPKEKVNSKGERIVTFSIGNSAFNKATNTFENKGFVNIFAKTNNLIYDRDKILIKNITGLDTNEYNGKQSITVFVELEEQTTTNYEPTSGDELPF